jgi:ABC-type transporter MlaC component
VAAIALACVANSARSRRVRRAERGDPQTADAVVAVLNDGALDTAQRRKRIEDIAYERFDFDTISRLVLGRNWRRSPRRSRSSCASSALLSGYGRHIDRYEQEEVKILGERAEQRGDVTVQTKIVGGQANDLQVDYRLRRKEGVWLVIDVVVEGAASSRTARSSPRCGARAGPRRS